MTCDLNPLASAVLVSPGTERVGPDPMPSAFRASFADSDSLQNHLN